MKKSILLFIFLLLPFTNLYATSVNAPSQEVNLIINSNGSAVGTWKLILVGRTVNELGVPEFKNYGTANSTKYKLNRIYGDDGVEISSYRVGDEAYAFNPGSFDANFGKIFSIEYSISSAFTTPVAIYELFLADGGFRNNPMVNVTYPKSWKLISAWPEIKSDQNNIVTLKYPTNDLASKPVLVAFQTNSGTGHVENYGKYTISGTKSEIQKIKNALDKITFVDDLINTTTTLTTPDNVLIVVDDLTRADQVGYEAEALAARPNIIVFNNRILDRKTTNEIAETLSHELMHLAMYKLNLFQGRAYFSSWFQEGLSVFIQTQVHNKIFTNKDEKILNEELNRTRVVSPSESKILYESNFDFDFSGSRDLGTAASYSHAGLAWGNFYLAKGSSGFRDLFASLTREGVNAFDNDFDNKILTAAKNISGLSEKELLYPGLSTNSISTTVGKISHSDNDENTSAVIVSEFIKNKIPHYFKGATVQMPAEPKNITEPAVDNIPTNTPSKTQLNSFLLKTEKNKTIVATTSSKKISTLSPENKIAPVQEVTPAVSKGKFSTFLGKMKSIFK